MLPGELAKYTGLFIKGGQVDGVPYNGRVPAEFFQLLREVTSGNPLRQAELEIVGVPPAVVCNYCRAVVCVAVEGGSVQKVRIPPVVGLTYSNNTYCGNPITRAMESAREWLNGDFGAVRSCPRDGGLMDDLRETTGNFPKVRVTLVE